MKSNTHMKRHLSLTLTCLLCAISSLAGNGIPVSFDERVDLMSVVWRMAGAEEYNTCGITPYTANVDSAFAPYRDHRAIAMARRYYKERGVGYDAVPSFALHLKICDGGSLVLDDGLADTMDQRWTAEMKGEFLKALNDFYRSSNFHRWHLTTRPLQRSCTEAFSTIANSVDMSWYETTFGRLSDFCITLCPLAGRNNYGLSVMTKDGRHVLSPVISCALYDNGSISYDTQAVLPIVIHEFCHAYCNPIVDCLYDEMEEKAVTAFEIKQDILSQQAYTNARIMLYESLVRACVIRYAMCHNDNGASLLPQLIASEESKGFLLVRDLLEAWERHGARLTGCDTARQTVLEAVNGFSRDKYEARRREAERDMVHYTCNLTDGQDNVPPGEFTLTVTFDRPMVPGISIGKTRHDFPQFKGYSWSDDARTLRVTFLLEPGHTYGLDILGSKYSSTDGKTAVERTVTFKTSAAVQPS